MEILLPIVNFLTIFFISTGSKTVEQSGRSKTPGSTSTAPQFRRLRPDPLGPAIPAVFSTHTQCRTHLMVPTSIRWTGTATAITWATRTLNNYIITINTRRFTRKTNRRRRSEVTADGGEWNSFQLFALCFHVKRIKKKGIRSIHAQT